MSVSFDAKFEDLEARVTKLETGRKRTARKTAVIPGLSQETKHLAGCIDDVNAAVEGLETRADAILERLDGMYMRFDALDDKLNANHELLTNLADRLEAFITAVGNRVSGARVNPRD